MADTASSRLMGFMELGEDEASGVSVSFVISAGCTPSTTNAVASVSLLIRSATCRVSSNTCAKSLPTLIFKPSVHEGFETRICLLYTSDAADEEDSVDLGGR